MGRLTEYRQLTQSEINQRNEILAALELDSKLLFRSPHLNRLIAVRGLDKSLLFALLDAYGFPTELINNPGNHDELTNFLESEIMKILFIHDKEKIEIPIKPISINSTKELKDLLATHPDREVQIYLTDSFMVEYFDRISTGMTEAQSKFYDKAFKKIHDDTTKNRS